MIEATRFRELVEADSVPGQSRDIILYPGDPQCDLIDFLLSHAAELLALVEASSKVQPWSHELSGAIWSEIRSNLTGRFEEQFTLHQQADRYERSSAHLDECARILAQRIEDKLFPPAPETAL